MYVTRVQFPVEPFFFHWLVSLFCSLLPDDAAAVRELFRTMIQIFTSELCFIRCKRKALRPVYVPAGGYVQRLEQRDAYQTNVHLGRCRSWLFVALCSGLGWCSSTIE
ncbi:hypothetical protein EV401DRAFT_423682 [Pisolithus croceorrhizus]|nr:hypothetical protein EV401DRAFT_423682 [Pisolithus croceorrhizus]